MKSNFLPAVVFFTIFSVSCSPSNDRDLADNNTSKEVISYTTLPTDSKTFIDTYFSNYQVEKVEKNATIPEDYYKVYLTDGVQVDFNKSYEWTEIDGNNKAIPTNFINSDITNYLAVNYPNTAIENIEKKSYGFEVELLNGIELRFDTNGQFLGVSDSSENKTIGSTIPYTDLSTDCKNFINTYFPNNKIVKVEKDNYSTNEFYQVYLTDGTKIDLNNSCDWTEVDGNNRAIPTNFINKSIVNYVSNKYPNSAIENIEKTTTGYEVDLLNGIELHFDTNGNPLTNPTNGGNTDGDSVQYTELPTGCKTFINTYFPNSQVTKVKKDKYSINEFYQVYLTNGTKIDLNNSCDWTEVDGNDRPIPTNFINNSIVNYVSNKYPNSAIENIEKTAYGFDVELLNGIELHFDTNGNILGNSTGSNTPTGLPESCNNFIKTHFANYQIAGVEHNNSTNEYYEVYLVGGTKIDLNNSCDWTEVDGNDRPIPTSFINKSIVDYISNRYPYSAIENIEKTAYGFNVELLNDTELVFDTNGNFIRVDD